MKTIGFFTLSLFLASGLVSCMREDVPGDSAPARQEVYSKIINTTVGARPSSLLIRVDEKTSCDSAAVAAVFGDDGSISYRRVFSSTITEDKLAVSKGLDRWFEISFDEKADLQAMAERLASSSEVEVVEFDTKPVLASDCSSLPYAMSTSPLAAESGSSMFDDPMLPSQWHYKNTGDHNITSTVKTGADIGVEDVWRIVGGDPGIVVAVVDAGVQYDHPDLAANMWINPGETENGQDDDGNGLVDDIHGWNFAAGGPLSWTEKGDSGHGTHVAGTVAAVNGNGIGVGGVAGGTGNSDGVKIMSCQIFSGFLSAGTSKTAAAIKYAADKGAHVLQCSWGYPAGSYTDDGHYRRSEGLVADAIDYFLEKPNDILDGGVVIFAAGNDGNSTSGYPAALLECISVTAFASDGLPAYYTCYGPGCNIAAPGGEYCTGGVDMKHEKTLVLSTMPTVSLPLYDSYGRKYGNSAKDYGYMQGTSMACPHVSGIAALGLSYLKKTGKKMTRAEFEDILLTSVDDINSDIKGFKKSIDKATNKPGSFNLAKYKNKMGTGMVNAWRFIMALEGTPCLTVKYGETQFLSLDAVFGGGSSSLTYTGLEISAEDKAALGLESDPVFSDGLLKFTPTKAGSAKMTVKAIAGGSSLGGGNGIGGSELVREVSVIARSVVSENGGWL